MTEIARTRWDKPHVVRALRQGLGLTAVSLAFGSAIGAGYFYNSDTSTEIAATEVEISPTLDNYVTIRGGALVPDLRFPSTAKTGVEIQLGNSTIPSGGMTSDNGTRLVSAYAAVAAQPDAEFDRAEHAVRSSFVTALELGGLGSTIPIAAFGLLGAQRRKELYENAAANKRSYVLAASALLLASTGGSGANSTPDNVAKAHWVPISSVFPGTENFPELENVEIRDSAVLGVAENLVAGGLQQYEESTLFYDALTETAKGSADKFHTRTEGQRVLFVVSDRHDNIGMDPALRATADAAGADALIDAGDDTSAGQTWEAFSLRSLLKSFKGYKIFAAGGNHDNDGFVIKFLEKAGAIVPNGEVQTDDDITMLLQSDPRRSDYTPERAPGDISFDEAKTEIEDVACESQERVALVIVHDANMGQQALDSGCVDLVIGGHTHRYSPPSQVIGSNGMSGYRVTNGTSGGAIYAITLGTKLRHEASALAITMENGRPVGVQHVNYTTSGTIEVDDYIELNLSEIVEPSSISVQKEKVLQP